MSELDIDEIEREVLRTIGRSEREQELGSYMLALIAEVRMLRDRLGLITIYDGTENHDHALCHEIARTDAIPQPPKEQP